MSFRDPRETKEIIMRRRRKFTWLQLLSSVLILAIAGSLACGTGEDSLTVYAGRSQNLVRPLLEAYIAENGSDIRVKYASSSSIAATILEEGEDTPADVVFLQDPGYLGSLSHAGLLAELPQDLLGRVDAAYRSSSGHWVGTSGRSRTVAYNTEAIDPEADLPDSVLDFADPEWRGRVGWAPLNASFQAFVTAFPAAVGRGRSAGLAGRYARQRGSGIPQQHDHRGGGGPARGGRGIGEPLLPGAVP